MEQSTDRIHTSSIGEYYADLLKVDAWIQNKSRANHAANLITSKLQEREARIKEQIEYLAKKNGMTAVDLWTKILCDTANNMEDRKF